MRNFLRAGLTAILILWAYPVLSQCGGIMEPGFAFLTSSRGCAPFTVNIQTIYLSSVPGTQYFITWGDGTPEETFTQVGPGGVVMSHTYPLASINCGYDVVIDAANACNPRGSVVPITTQVIVWTRDIVDINPGTIRVCVGSSATVQFTDNSTWNCFPRATRENSEPRWLKWIYGTGAAPRIPGVEVNNITPGAFPYTNPAPGSNPFYPVLSPGSVSLPIEVPATTPADIGKEFEVTLQNWNQCNPYDNNTLDGNGLNPVGGDLINGDNAPQVTTARIVIVPAPQPAFVTHQGSIGGPLRTVFCLDDPIYFQNQTPAIGGADFRYRWDFFDNAAGTGAPAGTSTSANPVFAYTTSGDKLIRLTVRDANAAGSCIATFESLVTISPSLTAAITITDLANVPVSGDFCQETGPPLSVFQVRFNDTSSGVATPSSVYRWEFYNESNTLVFEYPGPAAYSVTRLLQIDQAVSNPGVYRARLLIRDTLTSCQSSATSFVRVFRKAEPSFIVSRACEGSAHSFTDASTLTPIGSDAIQLREWDFDYDGVTFSKDPAFDNRTSFNRTLGPSGAYTIALRVTTTAGCQSLVTRSVMVDPLPAVAFRSDSPGGCSGITIRFHNTSQLVRNDSISSYEWELNEGSGFTTAAVQAQSDTIWDRRFTNTGLADKIVQVRLRAVSIHGCVTISSPLLLTINPGASSGFSSPGYSPFNDNCSPVGVSFFVDQATQDLSPVDYRWQIRDGAALIADVSSGTTPSFSHTFAVTDQVIHDFQVTLTTRLVSGCNSDSTRIIRVSPVPISDFTSDTIQFDCRAMALRFTAAQKGLEYHWQVSENGVVMTNLTTSQDVLDYSVNRAAADIAVAVTLQTRNLANCTSPPTTQAWVVPARDNLVASFLATPASQSLPSSTVFITNTTTAGPWTYSWDFGDGSTSNASTPTLQHTYATYGTYQITLTVTNNVCVEVASQTVVILAIPPIVDFSVDPPSGCAPLTVRFTNLSQFAEPDTYRWQFGSGQGVSSAIEPTYTYFEPGLYTVSLTASNLTGQSVTTTKTAVIEVFDRPGARFDLKPRLLYIPGTKLYTRNETVGASTYVWDFGDGFTSTDIEPSHEYTVAGIYSVSLLAISEHGCRDSVEMVQAVRVEQGGQVLVPNAFSPGATGFGGGGGSGGAGGGDGKNDVFLPLMRGVVQFEMLVFNRWGELLFESRDQQVGWDGYYQGRLCPPDVYMYKITALLENGERVIRTGDINLIR